MPSIAPQGRFDRWTQVAKPRAAGRKSRLLSKFSPVPTAHDGPVALPSGVCCRLLRKRRRAWPPDAAVTWQAHRRGARRHRLPSPPDRARTLRARGGAASAAAEAQGAAKLRSGCGGGGQLHGGRRVVRGQGDARAACRVAHTHKILCRQPCARMRLHRQWHRLSRSGALYCDLWEACLCCVLRQLCGMPSLRAPPAQPGRQLRHHVQRWRRGGGSHAEQRAAAE